VGQPHDMVSRPADRYNGFRCTSCRSQKHSSIPRWPPRQSPLPLSSTATPTGDGSETHPWPILTSGIAALLSLAAASSMAARGRSATQGCSGGSRETPDARIRQQRSLTRSGICVLFPPMLYQRCGWARLLSACVPPNPSAQLAKASGANDYDYRDPRDTICQKRRR
jgi:hypothetical protein